MESIKDRVAIVGMGCSKFGERWDAGDQDLLVESCYEAFEDAGIESKDIQAAWFGTTRLNSGRPLASAIKTEYIPITRVENACATASDAMMNGCYAVAAGMYDLVLVAGVEKLKDTGVGFLGGGTGGRGIEEAYNIYENVSGGGRGGGGTGVGAGTPPPAQFALAANRYFHQYGLMRVKDFWPRLPLRTTSTAPLIKKPISRGKSPKNRQLMLPCRPIPSASLTAAPTAMVLRPPSYAGLKWPRAFGTITSSARDSVYLLAGVRDSSAITMTSPILMKR